ncbi:serine/threonine-protein kinase [Microcoleus sp. F4-D5]|uniref:serine/threonine-protein kinase n=1 Tax=Microcoleus sp. F4-D5 TaxID=2818760 RepID=UPI002FCEC3E7
MEKQHQQGEIIADRYSILDILGQGGIGITYAAQDLQTDEKVALKAVSLRRTDDLKVLELFEREAKVLAQLKHPAVPFYIDYFEVGKRRDRFFYLAQQLADGQSLAGLIENGWHPPVTEVRWIANQILDILVYLQQLTPPVIHRDIKPQNIIRRDDGQIFLVDFGAVQDVYHQTITGGSTVVGTYGYMAPEQFRGKAVLATDLYGLGATLIYLLTGKAPADLPQRKLKMDFRSHLQVDRQFTEWLERMTEPVAADRFLSAKEALTVLRGEKEFTRSTTLELRRTVNTTIAIKHQKKQLLVEIPPIWLRTPYSQLFALLPIFGNGLILPVIWLLLQSDISIWEFLQIHFTIDWKLNDFMQYLWLLWIIYPPICAWMLAAFLVSAVSRTKILIDRQNIRLQRSLFGWCYKNVIGKTQDIIQVGQQAIGLSMNKSPIAVCTLQLKSRKHKFGTFLTEQEKAWLVAEINDFLGKH